MQGEKGRTEQDRTIQSHPLLPSQSDLDLHVHLSLLLVELSLLLRGGILVLLVLRDEIVHVRLSLCELHLVHALSGVPVKEGLSAVHGGELLCDALEHLLDRRRVTDEGDCHLETLGGNIADRGLDVVGNPLDEVGRVLVLNVEHLLIDLLRGHAATEHGARRQVASVSGIRGAHHVLGIEHLLSELGDRQRSVLLRSAGGEGGEANHEEVKTGEGDEVDSHLPEIGVELSGEAEAGGDSRHGCRDKVVQVSVGGGGELEGTEADVVKGLVIDDLDLIGVLDELMDRQSGVVGLDDSVGHLR
mmetsp:Transcript_41446/g.81748  ORF Transcript_41446/g.81748 Transcript_41446/m.81748 type:complete len:302 (-) Transcript_41446:634-1539(-)